MDNNAVVSPSTSPTSKSLDVSYATSARDESKSSSPLPQPLHSDDVLREAAVPSSSSASHETSPNHPTTNITNNKNTDVNDGRHEGSSRLLTAQDASSNNKPRRLKSAVELRPSADKQPAAARHASFSVVNHHHKNSDDDNPQPNSGSSSSSIRPPPPQLIICPKNRYVRQARIGRGAYKEVFRAMDEEEGIEVAWSEIDFSQCMSKSKVLQEVELLKRLDHPNIIGCFSSWEDPQRRCVVFVSELMTSGTLSEFIGQQSRKRLKRHAIERYGAQILRGLEHLHAHDVIHRDLKCHNVFINGSKGEVKIGDLGVSIASRQATSVIGTPEYMAPEMFSEHYTNAVDVWSFGLCLLEMSTGNRPYVECSNIGQIYMKVSSGVLPCLDGVEDDEVRSVITTCLAFQAANRPTAGQLLEHALFASQKPLQISSNLAALQTSSCLPLQQPSSQLLQRRGSDAEEGCGGLAATISTLPEEPGSEGETKDDLSDGSVGVAGAEAKSPSSGPGIENDSIAAGSSAPGLPFLLPPAKPHEFSISDRLQLLEWLRLAPAPVAGEILQFALRRLWIDAMDLENISHTSNPVSRANSMVAAGIAGSWGNNLFQQAQPLPLSLPQQQHIHAQQQQSFSSRASSASGVAAVAASGAQTTAASVTTSDTAVALASKGMNRDRSSPLMTSTAFPATSFRGGDSNSLDTPQQQQQQTISNMTTVTNQHAQESHVMMSKELFQGGSNSVAPPLMATTPAGSSSVVNGGGLGVVDFLHASSSPLPPIPTMLSPQQQSSLPLQQISSQPGSPHPVRPVAANHDVPSANLLLFIDNDEQHQQQSLTTEYLVSPSSLHSTTITTKNSYNNTNNNINYNNTSALQSPSSAASRAAGRPPLPPPASFSSLSPSMTASDGPVFSSSTVPILSGLSIPPPLLQTATTPGNGSRSLSNSTNNAAVTFPQTPSGAGGVPPQISFETSSASHSSSSHQPLSSPSSLSTTLNNIDANNSNNVAAEADRRKKAAAESVQKLMAQFQMFSGPPTSAGSSNPNIHGTMTTGPPHQGGASPLASDTSVVVSNNNQQNVVVRSITPPGVAATKQFTTAQQGGSFGDDTSLAGVASNSVDSLFGSPPREERTHDDSAKEPPPSLTAVLINDTPTTLHHQPLPLQDARPSFDDITTAMSQASSFSVPQFGE
ncbi:protein kinase, putative [Bodo saltans]|uniref:Protein kinase, putative n=1 Tax=Bodo saltans TaxID=75058 RepID=A0A0S4JFB8_BODSA|nr:protein kinase, putative [Bodo saltans]|eukprot:CUG88848.1 protein kinase, putative [Bodo saltans]